MIANVLQRHGVLALKNDSPPRLFQAGAQIGPAFAHGVQENAVRLDLADQRAERDRVRDIFAPRARIPGIVVNVNPDAAAVELAHDGAKAMQTAGQVAVKIKLIALVHANARIGVPEHNAVVAAEFAPAVFKKRFDPVAAGAPVVERFVAGHQKTAGVIGGGPCEFAPPVKSIAVAQALACFVAPLGEGGAVGRPQGGIIRSRDDAPGSIERESRLLFRSQEAARCRRALARIWRQEIAGAASCRRPGVISRPRAGLGCWLA